MKKLFSNLELEGDSLKHRPGSLFGCIALVAGTVVGAGVLALPAVTWNSGVLPSTATLIAVWFYTVISGLLIAEVNLKTIYKEGSPGLGLLTMTEHTLGKLGSAIAGIVYLFLHYAILVAYLTQGGGILASFIEKIGLVQDTLPQWLGSSLFALLFGGIIYFGSQRFVEKLNNAFVVIVVVSFIGLLVLGSIGVNPAKFFWQDWGAVKNAIPVMFVALFFQNVIPVITSQLEGDKGKIRHSIIVGTAIPLVMFLAWNAVILMSISSDMIQDFAVGKVFDPLEILRNGGGGKWLGIMVSVFSEFAIVTSFIGFMYGLMNFFTDALDLTTTDYNLPLPFYLLILLPLIGLSALSPSIFFIALDYAGTFGISILFGIIPAVMVWKQRYQKEEANFVTLNLVPGGRATLIAVIGIAWVVIAQQFLSKTGLLS